MKKEQNKMDFYFELMLTTYYSKITDNCCGSI